MFAIFILLDVQLDYFADAIVIVGVLAFQTMPHLMQ